MHLIAIYMYIYIHISYTKLKKQIKYDLNEIYLQVI